MGMLMRTPMASSQKLPPAIAASATTLSRLIVASASTMTAAAEMKSPVVPARPTTLTSPSCACALTLSAMTTSIHAPTSLTNGTPSRALAKRSMRSLSAIAPIAPRTTARRVSSGGSRRHARAMTIALSAPSSRSTKKICSRRKSQPAASVISAHPQAQIRPIRAPWSGRRASSSIRQPQGFWLSGDCAWGPDLRSRMKSASGPTIIVGAEFASAPL